MSFYLGHRSGEVCAVSRRAFLATLAIISAFFCPLGRASEALPDFDRRYENVRGPVNIGEERQGAHQALQARMPGIKVDFDPLLGTPAWIVPKQGFLSGPNGEGKAISTEAARAFNLKDPHHAIKAMLHEHRKLFGHGPEVLASARISRDYTTDNGLHTVYWEQQLDGIPVYLAKLGAHVTARGELVNIASTFVPEVAGAANAGVPRRKVLQLRPDISARQALVKAIQNIEENIPEEAIVQTAGPPLTPEQPLTPALSPSDGAREKLAHRFKAGNLPGEAEASLVWLPMGRERLRLCWAVELTRRARSEKFRVLVDAENGEVLLRHCLTFDISEATYQVFTGESPSPLSPTWPTPSRAQPPRVARELVTLSALDANASPLGWIDDGVNETRGNNVDAHLDRDGDDLPDLPRVRGNPFREFKFDLDLDRSPTNFGPAAVTQLFYWCNWMHDRLYQLGFTERLGNFQKDNFGRGGKGGDPVLADAQDGSGFNNANFTPAPEGKSPRIQIFIFDGSNPWRDADLDASVVLHEYTHGLSDRLVGGGGGINNGYQPFGMAEGWSDFFAQALLSKPGDDPDGVYACGGYSAYMYMGLQQNYYFGIRRYPYATDTTKNPLTFRHIYDDDVPDHPEIPRNPITTSGPTESHRMGEVWCTILWEVRASLIHKLGYEPGNETMLHLTVEGLRLLTKQNPNFIDARDAILQADDEAPYYSTNHAALWAGFAKRGLGDGADTWEIPFIGMYLKESFDVPSPLQVSFPPNFSPTVQIGAPFTPISANCFLRNQGQSNLFWWVGTSASWLDVTPDSGYLAGGGSTNILLTINSSATNLAPGIYTNEVYFRSQASSAVVTKWVTLYVVGSTTTVVVVNGMLQNTFPQDFFSYTFTPDTNSGLYSVCKYPAAGFPTDPSGGEVLNLLDDSYRLVTLTNGAEVSICQARTNKFFIGSNGDVVYTPPDDYTNNEALGLYALYFEPGDFFNRVRAGILYADLNPSVGGTVSWKQLEDRMAVSWQNVPEFGNDSKVNNFQIELFYNGVIRYTYCGVMTPNSLWIGFARGLDPNLPHQTSDLNASPSCYELGLTLPALVTEGDSAQTGFLWLVQPAIDNAVFHLQSSDTNAVMVPPTLLVRGNEASGSFPITVLDDNLLNGTRSVTISAQADNYAPISGAMLVADNETATLRLTLPANVTEGAGLLAGEGVVTISRAPDAPIRVRLSSSNTNWVGVPDTVTIPAGQLSAQFDLWIPDDTEINSNRTVTVEALVENWTPTSQTMTVADNESRQLRVVLPERFMQTSGFYPEAGRVELSGTLETNLYVSLSSDQPGVLSIPFGLILEAGSRTAYFDVTIINAMQTTDLVVIVSASADGFLSDSASTVVGGTAVPSAPASPYPPDGGVKLPMSGTTLLWDTAQPEWPGSLQFEVYFGTNPVPGQAEFQGTTLALFWPLPRLAFGSAYFWQIIATRGTNRVAGPVWRFTTVGLSHFEVSAVPAPQRMGVDFPVRITALDETLEAAVDFTGPAILRGLKPARTNSILITEVGTGGNDQVEFGNLSEHDIEISGWQIALYDWVSWPEPRATFTIPGQVMCPASNVFVLQRSVPTAFPGAFPRFMLGANLSWNITAVENPVAVLLRDASGNIVDFMCGMDADPAQITNPVAIPPEQWLGSPAPANLSLTQSLQRRGWADHNQAGDWVIAPTNIGTLNPGLTLPFVRQGPVALTPGLLAGFAQGTWTGMVKVTEMASAMVLEVEDGHGHFGTNAPFDVTFSDDLSVEVRPPSSRPHLGGTYAYVLIVSNTGPAASSGVILIDTLPPEGILDSVSLLQGTWTTNANRQVVCELGELAGNTNVLVTITVKPAVTGSYTNRAEVWRSEEEVYLPNNSATTATRVDYPWLAIGNVSKSEGNTTNVFTFPVTLSDQVSAPVTVNYYTSNGTAVAGIDYVAASNTLVFAPGLRSNNISVTVLGNLASESNKTFFVYLSDPQNAVIANSPAQGTIINDDFFFSGSVSISDATVVEGDDGTANAVFTVTLSQTAAKPTSVYYYTADGTASAGLDYIPAWGRLDFPSGVSNRTLSVSVLGDRLFESNETFFVKLSYADSIYIARSQGTGTIIDDDAGLLHHFAWTISGSNQWVNAPFAATLWAVDGAGRVVTTFNGGVHLRAGRQGQQLQIGSGTNLLEYPLGAAFQDERLQVIYPAAEIGRAGRITALGLRLYSLPGQTLNQWTIRMKHSPLTNFLNATSWADFGGASVYQANQTLASGGWVTFPLQAPFDYNGSDSLLVDFSFNNWDSSSDGLCFASVTTNQFRALGFRSDSFFGDPLSWVGNASPPPATLSFYPQLRLALNTPVGIATAGLQSQSVNSSSIGDLMLVNGIWSGQLYLQETGPDVVLLAQDDQGHAGTSSPLRSMSLSLTVDRIGDAVRIGFSTTVGQRYQIESAQQLMPLSWAPLSGIIDGAGEPYFFTNSVSGSTSRFYRVNMAP